MRPSEQAGATLSKFVRPTFGYGVTVWTFDTLEKLREAHGEVVQAVGEDFISLVNMKIHDTKQSHLDNYYIQIFG